MRVCVCVCGAVGSVPVHYVYVQRAIEEKLGGFADAVAATNGSVRKITCAPAICSF